MTTTDTTRTDNIDNPRQEAAVAFDFSTETTSLSERVLPLQYEHRVRKHETEVLDTSVSFRKELNKAGATYGAGYLGTSATIAVTPIRQEQVIADSGLALGIGGVQLIALGLLVIRGIRAHREGNKSLLLSVASTVGLYILGGISSIGIFKGE